MTSRLHVYIYDWNKRWMHHRIIYWLLSLNAVDQISTVHNVEFTTDAKIEAIINPKFQQFIIS